MNDQSPHRQEPANAWRLADNPIAIVGMSGLFPMARNFRDFWQNVVDAADCMSDVPPSRWDLDEYYDADPTVPDKTYCRRGGFVPEVPFSVTEFGLPPNQLEVTTVVQLLSLVVARNVLADAGATGSPWYRPERTGVVLGVAGPTTLSHPLAARLSTPVLEEVVRSCGLTAADAEQIADRYAAAFPDWEENSFPGLLGNVIAGRVANRLDLGGMNCTVDAACASSLSAVHMAISELVSGRADMMITGGCDTENSIFGYMCFSKVGALSRSGNIKPLDDGADGTLVGEGIGMLALKRLADAERDGDRVYAVIRGIGSSSDGRFKSIYAPRAEGQQAALRRAYADADCSPASIALFEAHATGTRVGDQTELTALNALLRAETDETGYAAIGSVKSQIGHTKGAAGAASLMKLALALHHKVLPPTINVTKPNAALDAASPLYVNTRTRPWIRDPRRPQRRAAASAMGFGGTNFHAVLEETTPGRDHLRTMHRTAHVHLWHAATPAELAELLGSGAEPNGDNGIPAEHARVGFVSRDEREAVTLRELAAAELARVADADDWSHPKGVFFRRHALPDLKVGALFAGQGSQYVDMGLAAVLNNPTVATAFDEANAVFTDAARPPAAVVFPPPVFDPEVRNAQENMLRRTEYAQPAIGALSVGQYRFLAERGLECAGFMGHSFGELTALWAAGSLAAEDFFTLARARGEAMAVDARDADPGTMAAVQATREQVTEILGAHPDVSVCNHNAPEQVVVGGGTDAVGALVADCRERGLTVRELPVAGAFHTGYVAHAVEPFRAAVEGIDIRAPRQRVYANSEGAEYGSDVAANRSALTGQLLRSVEFVHGLQAMHADGCNVFVEFGPKGTLTQFVRRTLGADVIAIATDQGPTGDSDVALKKAALQLAVLGAPIADVHRHDAPAFAEIAAEGMVVQLNGRDYVPDSRRNRYRTAIDAPVVLEAVSSAAAEAAEAARVLAETSAAATVSAAVPQSVAVAGPHGDAAYADAAVGGHADAAVDGYAAAAAGGYADAAVIGHANAAVGGYADAVPGRHADAVVDRHAVAVPVPSAVTVPDRYEAAIQPANSAPEPVYAGPGLDVITQQHLAIHSRYTEGQLEVAQGLVSVLREAQLTGDTDDRLLASVEAIKDQSLAIGQTHTRVNEILASLTELEYGGGTPAFAPPVPTAPQPHGTNGFHTGLPAGNGNGNGHENGHNNGHNNGHGNGNGAHALPTALSESPAGNSTGAPADRTEAAAPQTLPVPDPVAPIASAAQPLPVSEPVARVAPAAQPPVNGAATLDTDAVWSVLVDVVSEKTGYPPEMLALSMDLEADLGVDSIKRVQIMGALGERVDGVPTVGPEQVSELRTLNDIVGFVAAAAGAQAAPSAGSAAVDADAVWSVLVDVVSEKTGYPPEMLALSMDLEADLGVDSIKRVQIMGALGERVDGVPTVGPEQVAELRTLNDIVGFVATAAGAPVTGAPAAPSAGSTAVDADAVWSVLVEVVSEKTGYPPEMLALSMDLEADLGVDSIKRVQIMGALGERVDSVPAVGPEQVAELRTLNDIVGFVAGAGDAGAPAESSAGAAGADAVWSVLVEVVSEKTGYPPEMLALSMDLEADLGVDSIKRVQIMGALGERVDGVPEVGPEQVAELRKLNDIVGFVAGDAAVGDSAGSVEPEQIRAVDSGDSDADAEPVRLRIESVRLPGVDRADNPYAADRVALIVDHGDETAGVLGDALTRNGWTVHTATVAAEPDSGVASWDGATLAEALGTALESAARLDLCLTVLPADGQWPVGARALADTILTAKLVHDRLIETVEAGTRAAFVTLTRIDGALGHRGDRPAGVALVGGVGGLVKTLAQETPGLFCRALDLAPELAGDALIDTVLAELDDAAVDAREVAIDAYRNRSTVRPLPVETFDAAAELTVTTDDVLVVTGGARGVTAWCVRELASRCACEFLLLGRTDLEDEPEWAAGVEDGGLKAAAIAAVRAAGEQPTPKQIDRMARNQLAQREIRATVAAVAATGAKVRYLAVDITDPEATGQALAADAARVTGIVHGAGALADALLPAKTTADIRAVLATKLDGLHNVVGALPDAALRHVIVFGSVAGVFGNPGQADYAVANEALNRAAISWRQHGFAGHVTAVNWGAWDGGMVTPELREVFLARGVALLGMDAGARMFAEQFTTGRADDVSVLIGPAAPLAVAAQPAATRAFATHRDLASLAADPVILDHRVGQFPVFPTAAGLGWVINAVERANPGLRVIECSGFEVLKGIVYDGPGERDCRLEVQPGEVTGDRLTVKARITSTEPGKTFAPAHFAGTFVLAPASAPAPMTPAWPGYPIGEGPENGLDVYRDAHLFHGPLLQGVRRILERSDRRLVVECALADTPIGEGNYAGTLHSPVLADVVIQAGALLGVWFMDSGCLPLAIGRVEYFAPLPSSRPFVVVVDDLRPDATGKAVTVTVTACDPNGRVLQRFTDLFVVATPEMTEKFAEAVRLREQRG
ncbi:type I polyketide synthase [Nocardia aurantia]|uniref:Acyl carrier protein n=1 Tax=Nocardia aurantia TaxID=2585199 RepID=A0A7K0DNV2_9NOCA|nr:type I polyketide synthase [Nocardia aurantia]MQY27423.1 Acyl carrier protein [Nocardia aurantia]